MTTRARRILPVLFQHFTHRSRLAVLAALFERRHVGRRWGRRRGKNVLEQVFPADRRRGSGRIRRHRENGSLAEQAKTILIGERDRPEVAAVYARDAVVPRELLVEKRLVGGQQVCDAAVFFQLSVEKQLDLPDECHSQVVVEPGKPLVEIRRDQPDISYLQPLFEEVLHQRRARAFVAQQPPYFPLEHRRLVQLPADGRVEQLVIGDAAPQEERQTRRQLDVRKGVRRSRRDAGRIGFDLEQKIGAHEHTLDAGANARVEVSFSASGLIEAHERLDVVAGRRPPVRATRERRENLRGAGGLFTAAGGLADVYPLTAGRAW